MKDAKTIMLTVVLAASLTLAGCATYDSAVPASTGIGAGAGALLGYGLTGSGVGAAAGAGAGALAGALTGVAVDQSRVPAPPPQVYQQPPPGPYTPRLDPTRGIFLNSTPWRLEVYVDGASQPIYLDPWRRYPISLDIGSHGVEARAYVNTQFGERYAGTYRRQVDIDPRGSGWGLRFQERSFRPE